MAIAICSKCGNCIEYKLHCIVCENDQGDIEYTYLINKKEYQDYCAYKHIEPQIKGCLDRERELKQQLAKKRERN